MKKAQKVLILRFSSLGDIAIMIPVLRALSREYPNVEFNLASRPKMSPLLDEFENINFISLDIENDYKGIKKQSQLIIIGSARKGEMTKRWNN